jgi:translation initiation factor 2 subunit 2
VSRQGGVRTLWENFGKIANQIEKDEKHISDFVSSELGAKVSINANRGMLLYGRFNEGDFQSILRNYVKTYCKCTFCGYMATNLQQDTTFDIIICSYCGRNNSIPSIKKLKQFRKGNKIKTI